VKALFDLKFRAARRLKPYAAAFRISRTWAGE